ncbi:MAG: T9SS type A sorting domain-containing protein [bacterium]|nr:T9SS type A sorting domain-containing protein [bacterium]
MKAITILFLTISFLVTAWAQPYPDTLWTRTYGGSDYDRAHSVQQTTDRGYIIAGYTSSFGTGGYDMYLVKTNSQGDTLWTRMYGGSDDEEAYSVQQTSDGGYVVAGWTDSFGAGEDDFYLVKTNSQGDSLWTRTYGGGNVEEAFSIEQTTDGGNVVAGRTMSFGAGYYDFYVVKTDNLGDTLWTRTYGGSSWDWAYSVQQTEDGGYIVAGHTESFGAGSTDIYMVKVDSLGDTLWTRTYGGSDWDDVFSVQQTTDGGYVVAGYTYSFVTGSEDFYLVKTNSQGDTLWTRTYGGSNGEEAFSVRQTADGGYIVAGSTTSFGLGTPTWVNSWLVKTNSQGDTFWTRTYGGDRDDRAFSVQPTADGGYIIAGATMSFGAGQTDFYLVKTGPDQLDAEPISVIAPKEYVLHPNFPNPFNATTQIGYELPKASRVTLAVFNLLGEEVASLVDEVQAAGMHTVVFEGSGLASGVYLYRMQTDGFVQTRKMVLLK